MVSSISEPSTCGSGLRGRSIVWSGWRDTSIPWEIRFLAQNRWHFEQKMLDMFGFSIALGFFFEDRKNYTPLAKEKFTHLAPLRNTSSLTRTHSPMILKEIVTWERMISVQQKYLKGWVALLFWVVSFQLHSGNLTWQWNIPMFTGKYIFTGSIFHLYVSLPEGILYFHPCLGEILHFDVSLFF